MPAPHFDAGLTVLEAIESGTMHRVLHGVPTMFLAELDHPATEAGGTCRACAPASWPGAPCPPELTAPASSIGAGYAASILVGYGQTEASPITHMHALPVTRGNAASETVGTNLPHQEVKVVDPTIREQWSPSARQGEVCFRGHHVMRGVPTTSPRPPAAAIGTRPAGCAPVIWGVMNADGYLKVTGRLKEMIIRGGENIYPAEIEAFYYGHPKVAEIAVFGIPDERLGEEIGAWIRLHEGETATPDELRGYAKGQISHFKVPRQIMLVDEFPTTVTGKIQKFRIAEMMARQGITA